MTAAAVGHQAPEEAWDGLHVVGGLFLTDANGTVYRVEHAGAWDGPEGDERSGVYYEDEELPEGAVSLYRIDVLRGTHG